MSHKKENKSKIVESATSLKQEVIDPELKMKQDLNVRINVKTYSEPTRPYFSSPCMLSDIADNPDFIDSYF